MSFQAKYPGVCCQCNEDIVPGQECQYWGDEVGHVKCPEVVDLDAPGRNERRCGDCFQIHAGECA